MGQYAELASTMLRILIVICIAALAILFVIDWLVFEVGGGILKAVAMTVFFLVIALGAINKDSLSK